MRLVLAAASFGVRRLDAALALPFLSTRNRVQGIFRVHARYCEREPQGGKRKLRQAGAQSEDGVPLEPVTVRFQTGKEKP
jgi:hypothetical protein